MNRIQVWIHASRPKTLAASISPALIGGTLAISQGYFNLFNFLFTVLTGLFIQIATNLANDYFDFVKGADTVERKGFMRVTQAGLVTPSTMKRATLVMFTLAFLCGCYLIWQGGLAIAFILALYLLLSFLYTAGPFPLAYLGLGDLFVFFLYGPAAVMITYYLQAKTLSLEALTIGFSPGALSMAILTVNNVRDIEEDRKAGKNTLPVRLGKRFGQGQFIVSLLLALIPPCIFYPFHPFSLLTLLVLLPIFPLIHKMAYYQDPRELNQLLVKTGQLLWVFTLLFCIGWML
jgi:1,4-dihydroxy-2-naphthoate octaprenyltransferase